MEYSGLRLEADYDAQEEWVALVNELNEASDGAVKVSSPYILVLAHNHKAS